MVLTVTLISPFHFKLKTNKKFKKKKLDICKIVTTAFRSPIAHNVPGFLNPNEIRIEYYSKYTDLSMKLWRKMTDTDPDRVPVRNDSLGQKEKEWT